MMGFEPTTRKAHGLLTTPFVKVLVGVLVRLTTCKRLTNNSSPKLSLITPSPPETARYQVGWIYGGTCQYPSGFFLGIPGRVLFKFNMGKV